MKTLLINGSNGFLGSQICEYFKDKYHIVCLNRADYLINPNDLADKIKDADIIFNLAGARISPFALKCSRRIIYDSRVLTTRNLFKAIDLLETMPELIISMSAVGIYDFIHIHDESSVFYGNDFLAEVSTEWENAAKSTLYNGNVLILRSGIILAANGGAFNKLIWPFKIGFGAIIGTGFQSFPFIHIFDFLKAIEFSINQHLTGIVNFVAPASCSNREFSVSVSNKLGKPLLFRIPARVFKILMGKQSSMLLNGQQVVPKVLLDNNFEFKYNNIDSAINNLINI